MANKKKPEPAKKQKPVNGKKTEPASKKRTKPAKMKKPAPAEKAKATKPSADKTKPKKPSADKTKPKRPSVNKARPEGKELLRRAAVAALAILVVCGVVLSAFSAHNEQLQRKITLKYTGVLQTNGVFPIAFRDEQVQENVRATKRHGQTHAFSYFCNGTLRLSTVNMTGLILFGNPADNDCVLVLSVFDKEDNLIYRSGGVEPGNYITKIHPAVEWENGEYDCMAYVSAYKGQGTDYKCIGVQYTPLTVKVGEKL